jgi:glycerol-3-phosphate O-acyltransferase
MLELGRACSVWCNGSPRLHVHIPRGDQDYAIEVGLRMLRLRHLVAEVDGLYRINADETELLRYYANSIAHLLAMPAVAQAAE